MDDTDAVGGYIGQLTAAIAACRWWQRRKRRQLQVTLRAVRDHFGR